MAQEAVFVTNNKGTTHNVPGEWVLDDETSPFEGAVTVRGNAGYRRSTEDEIDKWHDDQGLDNDVRDEGVEPDEEAIPQIHNMTVEQPGQTALPDNKSTSDNKSAPKK